MVDLEMLSIQSIGSPVLRLIFFGSTFLHVGLT